MIGFTMKNRQSSGSSPAHQTVASSIKFKSDGQSIEIEFTDQQLSAHADTATLGFSAPERLDRFGAEMSAASGIDSNNALMAQR
jgi:hypothetical protein